MRQVGIFAAACHYALDHHLERLRDDHVHALCIAEMLVASARIRLDVKTVQTNIIVFGLGDGAPDAATVVQQAKERGVLLFAFGARTVRAVTHMDVTKSQCERAAEILLEIIDA
jgi:threonine aldolase